MSDERKPVAAYVEAAPDGGEVVLCRIGAPNVARNEYFIYEGEDVTIYPGHEERFTEAEWREKQREQRPDPEVIEWADLARFGGVIEQCISFFSREIGDCERCPEIESQITEELRDLLAAVEAEREGQAAQ